MLAILDKIIYMYKRTYKRLYRKWTQKLSSLMSTVNVFLVLVVTGYTEKYLRALKKAMK